jgi:hypothetical protein
MTTHQHLVKKITDKTEWLEEAASFLKGKTATGLYDIYQVMSRVEYGEEIQDRFVSAMRAHFTDNVRMAIATSMLLLGDEDGALREEVYWILKSYMYTNNVAREMIWNRLLADADDGVFMDVYAYATEDFRGAKNEPLSALVYVAGQINSYKFRYDTLLSQTSR